MPKQEYRIYIDLTVFVGAMMVTNMLWKWLVPADDVGVGLSEHIARVVFLSIHSFNDHIHLINDYILQWDNGHQTAIVGACSGIKQMTIWAVVMLASRPRLLAHERLQVWKFLFIPVGWGAAYIFNVLRIFAITLIIENRPELFDLFHAYIFKYLFYAMLFGLWLVWEYRFALREA